MRRDQPSPNEITPDFRRDVSVGGWPRLCIKLGNKVIIFGRRKGYLDAVVVFRDRRQGNIGFFGTRQLVATRPSFPETRGCPEDCRRSCASVLEPFLRAVMHRSLSFKAARRNSRWCVKKTAVSSFVIGMSFHRVEKLPLVGAISRRPGSSSQ